MKKTLAAFALTTLCIPALANAAGLEAHFDAATNSIVIPKLEVDGKTYYATLTLTNAATFEFKANLQTLTDITRPASTLPLNSSATAIVGTWTDNVPNVSSSYLKFFSDGRYEQLQRAGDDINCTKGGLETGTWVWDAATGLLITKTLTDANLSCGLSNPLDGVPLRVYINGNAMQVIEKTGSLNPLEFGLTKVGS